MMNIICNRQTLSDAANHISRVVSTKSAMAALEGILISANNGFLTLSGYDLEIGMTKKIEAKIEVPGSIILNARLFCDIVRRLPEDKVIIRVDEKLICEIISGKSEFSLIGLNAAEFPELPNVNDGFSLNLPGTLLQSMVRQTIFSVAQNDAKPVHTGILYEISKNSIKLVAVDGYRMAVRIEPIDCKEELSFIVPAKAMDEVIKLISNEGDQINFVVSKRHIIFEVNGFSVISRLLDGEFLDYNKAIPKVVNTRVTASTRTILETIERISQLILDRLKTPVRCVIENNIFKASCTTEIGKANDEFPVKCEGEKIEIGFNNRYLIEALKAVESDEVVLELGGALSPMVIRPVEGESFLFLVLPVRLKNEG